MVDLHPIRASIFKKACNSVSVTTETPGTLSQTGSPITLYLIDRCCYTKIWSQDQTVNPIFTGAYLPGPKINMLKVSALRVMHDMARSYTDDMPSTIANYPRAYYGLYGDPDNPAKPTNILYHRRFRLSTDPEVQGWVASFSPSTMLHLLVEMYNIKRKDDSPPPPDEPPFKSKDEWDAEGIFENLGTDNEQ